MTTLFDLPPIEPNVLRGMGRRCAARYFWRDRHDPSDRIGIRIRCQNEAKTMRERWPVCGVHARSQRVVFHQDDAKEGTA